MNHARTAEGAPSVAAADDEGHHDAGFADPAQPGVVPPDADPVDDGQDRGDHRRAHDHRRRT